MELPKGYGVSEEKLRMMLVNRKNIFDFLYLVVGTPWLFMMLFTTRLYSMVKIVLLGVLVMLAFTEILIKGIPLVSKHVRFVFFFLVYMVFSLLLGVLSGYEFSMEIDNALIQYYMITPICVLLLSTVVGKFNYRKEYLWKCIVVLTCLLAVLDVAKVASSMVGLSLPFLNFIDLGSLDMTEGLAVRASNETSLLFLLPIIIFLLVNDTGKKLFAVYLVTTLFGLAYAFISGRRILDIEIVISFAYALWYYKMKKQKNTPPRPSERKDTYYCGQQYYSQCLLLRMVID